MAKKSNSKGILIYASNTENINYLSIACLNIALISKNMPGVPVTVVSDSKSIMSLDNASKQALDLADNIITLDTSLPDENFCFVDTRYDHTWYDISPYDETIVLDPDYLILNDTLNTYWDLNADMVVIDKSMTVDSSTSTIAYVNHKRDLKLIWGAAVYFKKTPFAQHFFNVMRTVTANYEFARRSFQIEGTNYRRDHMLSIAHHIVTGGITHMPETGEVINSPFPLVVASAVSEVLDFKGHGQVILKIVDKDYGLCPILSACNTLPMNKIDLSRKSSILTNRIMKNV